VVNVSTNVCAKFRCAPLPTTKALEIFKRTYNNKGSAFRVQKIPHVISRTLSIEYSSPPDPLEGMEGKGKEEGTEKGDGEAKGGEV